MPTRSNHLDNPTVRRLLEAAEQEFEQHGFAGARVDGIAARARTAKSHVYYHFEGKQQIFDDLISLRLREILAAKEALATGIEALDHKTLSRFLRRAIDELIVPRAAFIRIILLESLGAGEAKARHSEPLLMKVLRPVLEDWLQRFKALGYAVEREAFLSDLFHFGLLPTVLHVAFGDRWANAAGIAPARAHELFLSRLVQLQSLNVAHIKRTQRGRRRADRST